MTSLRAAAIALACCALVGCKDDPDPPTGGCEELEDIGFAGEVTHEQVAIDWEAVRGGGSASDLLEFGVPRDLESLLLVVEAGESFTAIGTLRQGDVVYLDNEADPFGETAPYFHTLNPAGAVALPANEDSSIAPGCTTIQGVSDEDLSARRGILHIVSRRRPAGGSLHVTVVVVGDTDLGEVTVEELRDEMALVFSDAGIDSRIEIAAVPGPAFVNAEGAGAAAVRASYVPADELQILVYLIQGFADEPFTLGFAAGIPGPNGVVGTVSSGVIVAVDAHIDDEGFLDPVLLAETASHEVGHQIGLFHTTEDTGDIFDEIGDTPECDVSFDLDEDGELTAEECEFADGQNLMFWLSALEFSQRTLSTAQRRLIQLSPVTR